MDLEKKNKHIDRKLRIIAPLIAMDAKERRRYYRQVAEANNISIATLKNWLRQYDEGKLNGLAPKYKGSGNHVKLFAGFETALARAVEIRRCDPTISVKNIIIVLESEHPEWKGLIKRATLQRHLQQAHVTLKDLRQEERNKGRKVYGRYRKEHRLDQVQCDVKVFPNVCVNASGVQCHAYLQVFLDNHSRKILSYKLSEEQNAEIALSALRAMVEQYGRIDSILTDNGSIYRGAQMARACELLGIELKFCKPYHPEGKGALERLNSTINAIENQIVDCENVSLEFLVETVGLWVQQYNDTSSNALDGRTPNYVFDNDTKALQYLQQDVISQAFMRLESRKVQKDGVISFEGKLYEVDTILSRGASRISFLVSLDNKLEMILPDNTTIPMKPIEIKSDVDKKVYEAEYCQKPDLPIPPLLAALHREQARREHRYKDEETFIKELKEKFHFKEQKPEELEITKKDKKKKLGSTKATADKSKANSNNATLKNGDVKDSPFANMQSSSSMPEKKEDKS